MTTTRDVQRNSGPASVARGPGSRLTAIDRKTRTFALQHPFAAVGAAVLVGYLVGRVRTR